MVKEDKFELENMLTKTVEIVREITPKFVWFRGEYI